VRLQARSVAISYAVVHALATSRRTDFLFAFCRFLLWQRFRNLIDLWPMFRGWDFVMGRAHKNRFHSHVVENDAINLRLNSTFDFILTRKNLHGEYSNLHYQNRVELRKST